MNIRGGTLAILASTAFVAAPTIARAAARPIDLAWSAPEECPSRDQFVEALVRDPSESTGAPLRFSIAITKKGRSFSLALSGASAAQRTFEGSTCEEVLDAASLVLALQLEGEDATPAAPKEPEAPVAPTTPTATPPPRNESPWEWFARAAMSLDVGTFGTPSVGVEGAIGTDVGRLRMEAAFGAFLPNRETAALHTLTGHALYGRARVSWRAAGEKVTLRPFATFDYTYAWAESDGGSFARSTSASWLSVGAGAMGEWRLSRGFSVIGSLEGVVPLARPDLGLPDLSLSMRAESAAFRALLGVQVHFL